MSRLIDADKLKASVAEKYVRQRKNKKEWWEESLSVMEIIDSQPEVMITCCKCHGNGTYNLPKIDRRDWDIADEWEQPRKCLICKGTGKITIDEYEDYQERCRWKK